jgi:5-methylcytosine-specific restriction endonuclease McrA
MHNTKDLAMQSLPKQAEPLSRYCPGCKEERVSDNFYRCRTGLGRSKYCKSCANRQTVLRQQRLKQAAVDYKGGRCSHCGYSRYIGSLEFHHIDPLRKDFNLAAAHCTTFEKIKSELDKCIILCANCHREEHARLKGLL